MWANELPTVAVRTGRVVIGKTILFSQWVAGVKIFFFQAEDGIRYIGVTGFRRVLFRSVYGYDAGGRLTSVRATAGEQCTTRTYGIDAAADRRTLTEYAAAADGSCQTTTATTTTSLRSAERRVGKECRSRRSPHH